MSNEELHRQVLDVIVQLHGDLGRTPTQREYDNRRVGLPTAATLYKRGLGWNDLIVEAGFEPHEPVATRKDNGSAPPADPAFPQGDDHV